jgi:hypothetical protein
LRQKERADAFPIKFPGIRTIPTTGLDVKIIIPCLKAKISWSYGGITGKVSKVFHL